ncbi:FAD dependent oxidoreductase [Desulfonema limicola]|uniref:Glycerol-3-phosphate dehydrogenase n=1 Tax=Desulfonema limicola TaxID=45656 RepID=A0A975B8S8_9BACT|nr:FAD dependent oxidoreductase [Desulfonema limicola]
MIIGGGVTGTGLARDLGLRGISSILVEKQDINAGASGGNHGLLHSGARYAASDSEAAAECREEGELLKKLAPQCIEDTGGLFVAVKGDNENYTADFPGMCEKSGIKADFIDIAEVLEMEPLLSPDIIAAYQVSDASIDPFMLSLDNISHARDLGAVLMRYTKLESFNIENKKIKTALVRNTVTGQETIIEPEQVVSAAGAWAGIVAGLAGIKLDLVCSMGTLLVTQSRLAKKVINRLRKASDADILVPGGTVSILGTTSVRIDDPDKCRPTIPETDYIIEQGAAMIPALETTQYIRAYSGVRPLTGSSSGDDRNVSRGFALIDHAKDRVENLTTISGGKLTTFRLMAEKTADLICRKMGISKTCTTRTVPLPGSKEGRWTAPGLAPRMWMTGHKSDDIILCECEMVSKGIIDNIIKSCRQQGEVPTLKTVGIRSRIGKGPCQGGFCSARIAAHMYDREEFSGKKGLNELREFLNERWRGKHPVLWGLPLEQAELQEALHCGFFGLEL